MTLKGIHLEAKGSGGNLGELRSMLGEKLPNTGPVTAKARLTSCSQALTVPYLNAEITQGNSQLVASGKIGDVLKLTGIELKLKGSGGNLGELDPLFDNQLPCLGPFALKGQLIGSDKLLELNSFSATADQSDFKGRAKLDLGKRPKLTLRLESGLVDLAVDLTSQGNWLHRLWQTSTEPPVPLLARATCPAFWTCSRKVSLAG